MPAQPQQQVQQRTPFGSTNWSGNTATTDYDPRLLEDFWAQTDQRQNQRNVYGLAADQFYRQNTGANADPRAGNVGFVSQLPATQYQSGFDTGGMVGIPGAQGRGGFGGERQRVEDATYDRYTSRLDPRFAREGTDLTTRLREQGLAPGTDAFNEAFQSFNQGKNDAYQGAARDAVTSGGAEQSRLLADALRARQQQFGEGQQALTNFNNAGNLNLNQHAVAAGLQNDVSQRQFEQNRAVSGDARANLQTAQSGLPQGTMLPQFDVGLQGIDEGQASRNARTAWLEQLMPLLTGNGGSGGTGGGAAGGLGSLVGQGGQAILNWLRGGGDPTEGPPMSPGDAYGPNSGWEDVPNGGDGDDYSGGNSYLGWWGDGNDSFYG